MVDDTHRLLKGSIKEIALWESIIRGCDPSLALEKRNGNQPLFSKWVKDTEQESGPVVTRVYKTSIIIDGLIREARIKFIYDGREDIGKIIIAMPNEYKGILKPIPNPALGITELLVGERVHTSCSVCKIPEGGLGVNIICPFCHGMEQHRCKE
jgi:hypothetical protein